VEAGVKDLEVIRAWRELWYAVTVLIVKGDAEADLEILVLLAKTSVIHFRFLQDDRAQNHTENVQSSLQLCT
jgi:hypothetical protein